MLNSIKEIMELWVLHDCESIYRVHGQIQVLSKNNEKHNSFIQL